MATKENTKMIILKQIAIETFMTFTLDTQTTKSKFIDHALKISHHRSQSLNFIMNLM